VTAYTTDAAVREAAGLPVGDPDPGIPRAVAAANAFASKLPHAPADANDPEFVEGVLLLAVRYYKRKYSPEGVGTFGEVALYAPRRDPDVDQLLRLGAWSPPRVG
jgi:hypothetical protein